MICEQAMCMGVLGTVAGYEEGKAYREEFGNCNVGRGVAVSLMWHEI